MPHRAGGYAALLLPSAQKAAQADRDGWAASGWRGTIGAEAAAASSALRQCPWQRAGANGAKPLGAAVCKIKEKHGRRVGGGGNCTLEVAASTHQQASNGPWGKKILTSTTATSLQRDRFQTRIDANALELFARVHEAGSFAAAGRALGLTRAAVSSRIAAVESQIGLPLFVRHSRALGLTETGRGLIAQAQAVLAATDSARRDLRTRTGTPHQPGLQGSLRISSCPSYGQDVLAPRLAAFQSLHPQLRIELQFGNRSVDLARENFDIAFRMTSRPPEDCVATPVLRFAIRAWAAPGAVPVLAQPAALALQRCLVWGASTEQLRVVWVHGESGTEESVLLQPGLCADDLRTLVGLAAEGGGVVFAPAFAITGCLDRGALHEVLPGWTAQVDLGDEVYALTLAHNVAPAAARALVDYVRVS